MSAGSPSDLDRPCRRDEGLAAEKVGGEFALHDGSTGRVHFLNETAAVVWDLCDGSRTFAAIVDEVARVYAQPTSEVRDGVAEVLSRLGREGLVTWAAQA